MPTFENIDITYIEHLIGIYVIGAFLEQFQTWSRPAKLDQKETFPQKASRAGSVGRVLDFSSSRYGLFKS